MEISGKRKRSENEEERKEEEEEAAQMEKFSQIVEKFRAPYDWFSAKMCGSIRSATNDGDRRTNNNEKLSDDVWMPSFLLRDFEEEEVIKVWKSKALRKPETAAITTETIEEQENNEELDLRLCL